MESVHLRQLQIALKEFAGIDETAFSLSKEFWKEHHFRKGEFYNEYKNVCKRLGFVIEGIFRTYHVSSDSGEQRNMFFYSEQQLVISYKSFVEQSPCNYFTEAMLDSTILYIHVDSLQRLYSLSKDWERFGRLIAERAFVMAMSKAESFMFRKPEECYIELVSQHRDLTERVPLYHIASYLGIQAPSLSRIRRKLIGKA